MGLPFYFTNVPVYLAFVFGGIALATAPAPALSIVNEFHARGPVTDTLLPMTVLDDVVGITATMLIGWLINTYLLSGVTLNYMLMGVSFSAVFSNMITTEQLEKINYFLPPFSPLLCMPLSLTLEPLWIIT